MEFDRFLRSNQKPIPNLISATIRRSIGPQDGILFLCDIQEMID
jgi:hypothetical protein